MKMFPDVNKFLLLLALAAPAAHAQSNNPSSILHPPSSTATNAPKRYVQPAAPIVNPGLATLAGISNQIAALQKKVSDLSAKRAIEDRRVSLRLQAKQLTQDQYLAYVKSVQVETKTQRQPLEDQIAALRLKEFETRQTYKIPEASSHGSVRARARKAVEKNSTK